MNNIRRINALRISLTNKETQLPTLRERALKDRTKILSEVSIIKEKLNQINYEQYNNTNGFSRTV